MRIGFVSSVLGLVAGAGLALAQPLPAPPAAGAPAVGPASAAPPSPAAGFPSSAGSPLPYPYAPFPAPPPVPGAAFGNDDAPVRYFRDNAFKPKHHLQENAFGPDQTLPEDFHDNAFSADDLGSPGCYVWGSAEYLFWWVRNPAEVPLLTTSTALGGTGILGTPGVQVRIAGGEADGGERNGTRLAAGCWFDSHHTWGIEGRFFWLGDRASQYAAASDPTGRPVYTRPIINARTGLESAVFVSFPDQFAGRIDVTTSSFFQGADANLVLNPFGRTYLYPDLLIGLRYLELDESLDFLHRSTILPAGRSGFSGAIVGPRDTLILRDRFTAENQFFGGQVGARFGHDFGTVFLQLVSTAGLGVTQYEAVTVDGSTTLIPNRGAVRTVRGGLLALNSNIGRYSPADQLSVVSELGVTIGYHITRCLDTYLGYSFLYWSDVIRPGEQIDRAINPALLPSAFPRPTGGPARPLFPSRETDFWAQGIHVGLALRY